MLAASALGQAPSSASPAKSVSRTTKAVNYRRAGAAKIDFQGTELMQQASGEARVQNKGSRTEIDAKFLGLDEATKFGLEYLTYVLWAVSPGGRAVNLGEVVLKNGAGEVKAISDMQTFGMIVTAEPYFAVTQPGNTVVLENVLAPPRSAKSKTSTPATNFSVAASILLPTPKSRTPFLASTAKRRSNFLKRATPCASRTSPWLTNMPLPHSPKPNSSSRMPKTFTPARATKNPSSPPLAKLSKPPKKLASWP